MQTAKTIFAGIGVVTTGVMSFRGFCYLKDNIPYWLEQPRSRRTA